MNPPSRARWTAHVVLAVALAGGTAEAQSRSRYSEQTLARELGRLEKRAVTEALERENTTVDPEPANKRVGKIRVVNLDVFAQADGFLHALNWFHITTKPYVIEREVLVRPGQLWDQSKIDETERALEVPEFSNLVVILPVHSDDPASVDVLVVTRDVWSLRFNSRFDIQNGTIVRLIMFPAENNSLGRRKQVAAAFDMDLGSVAIGPSYTDPNILGTRLRFTGFTQAIFHRYEKNLEGNRTQATLSLPLWSLERRWGAAISFARADFVSRSFRDTSVLLHPDPERVGADPDEERAPREFRLRTTDLAGEGVYSVGTAFENRFALGYAISVRRPELLESFPGSPELAVLFEDEVLGRSERIAGPTLRYEGFQPVFARYKNVNTLDLVENVRLGPEATIALSSGIEELGSEVDLFQFRAELGWTLALSDTGFVRMVAGGGARIDAGGVTSADLTGSVRAALPSMGDFGRILINGQITDLLENEDDRILLVGGGTGLRGYPVGQFAGEASAVVNVELRTEPIAYKFFRFGGAAFWDMGHAAETLADLGFHHDVGIGFRVLIPQDSPFVNRFDWALPLSGDLAGFPGRLSISFGQYF